MDPLIERKLSQTVPLTVVTSTAVAVAGSFVFGISVGYSSPAQTGIMLDLGLSLAEYSLFASIVTIGAMLGAIVSGSITEKVGRRYAMSIADAFCIAGWLSIVLSKNYWYLDAGRFLVGCGIGLFSYVVPVYISEISPKNLRGSFATVNQLMICCGASLAYLLGTILSWRALAMLGVAPCLFQLLGLFFIPESPRWLIWQKYKKMSKAGISIFALSAFYAVCVGFDAARVLPLFLLSTKLQMSKVGHYQEFEVALQKLRGNSVDIFEEAEEIKEFTKKLMHQKEASLIDLFQKEYIHAVTVGVGLMVLQQFGGVNAICFYASEIFVSAGFSSGNSGMIAMVIVQVPMTTLGMLLMDKAGRRPLLLVSAAGTCLGCFLVGLSFLSQDYQWAKNLNIILALTGILVLGLPLFLIYYLIKSDSVYTGSFSLGMGGIPWVIMSEIFPINMKGSAGSLVTLVSWLGSWMVSYTFNFLMLWSSVGTFFLFASICGFTVLFVARLVPETKGRTLEDIQASMSSL